jgi:hypothetical protein
MRKLLRPRGAIFAVVFAAVFALTSAAFADGTETLGTPSIPIAQANGTASGGVGLLLAQPGVINVSVPADATVNQTLLYWEGQFVCTNLDQTDCSTQPDPTIDVNGTSVTGTLIGGPTFFFVGPGGNYFSATFRADITSLDVVGPGNNAVSVGGLTFTNNNGAGIVALYSSPSAPAASVQLVDGNDLAFRDFAPTLDATVPQTFNFSASNTDRTAPLTLLASSVADGRYRPNTVVVTSGANTQTFLDPLQSLDGREWDTVTLNVTIPAGATSVTVQLVSDDHGTGGLPASLTWSAASLTVPAPPPPPPAGCTLTQGYWKTHSKYGPATPRDATWDQITPSGEDSTFFLSGQSYIQVMNTAPAGNAYYILADQYIAAQLNTLAGASAPQSVVDAFNTATTLFQTYTPAQIKVLAGNNALRQQFVSLATILDNYNNGLSGVSHCDDQETLPS